MEIFIKQFIFSPKFRLFRHLAFWVLLYIDELLSLFGLTAELEFPQITIAQLFLDMVVVYVTIYYLIPRFFLRKKYSIFLFFVFVAVFLNAQLYLWVESQYYYYEAEHLSIYLTIFISTCSILGLAIAFKLMKIQVDQAKDREQLIVEKNRVELQSLKDQINPHFLFNVLNTIFIQTKVAPDEASEAIMKLSDMLRYQIYDASDKELVSVATELDFLRNYTDLETLRRDKLVVHWDLKQDLNALLVPPFIFLPLVENAVKHSKSSSFQEEKIQIQLSVQGDRLSFACKNTIGDLSHDSGGFGLKNLKKRLQLLFQEAYALHLDKKESTFSAELLVDLDELHNN